MARPKRITFIMAAADPDGIAESQTPAAGGAQDLTLDGALVTDDVATLAVPRHVSIASAGDDSARTFTVIGTDRYGAALTETIAGPNTTTVIGTKNFATVTAVGVDDDTAGAITVGSADEAETAWIPLNTRMADWAATVTFEFSGAGGMLATLQATYEDVFAADFDAETANTFAHEVLVDLDLDEIAALQRAVAIRLAVADYTAATHQVVVTLLEARP